MVRLNLTEPMVNQLGAALDERNQQLSANLGRLALQPESESRDFAIETTREAIRDVISTRLAIAAALEEPEPPGDATFHSEFHGENPTPETCQACRDEEASFVKFGWAESYPFPESELRALAGDR